MARPRMDFERMALCNEHTRPAAVMIVRGRVLVYCPCRFDGAFDPRAIKKPLGSGLNREGFFSISTWQFARSHKAIERYKGRSVGIAPYGLRPRVRWSVSSTFVAADISGGCARQIAGESSLERR